jgi:hypothetical protein
MSNIKDRYVFVTDNEDNWQCIGIRGGQFDGVVYKYGKITIPEPPEKDIEKDLTLKFEYDIVSTNNLPAEWFGEEFFNLIGDILVDILDERMKEGTLEYVTND